MNPTEADIVIDTADADQTAAVGEAVGRCCAVGDLIALEGELGAGKTQFVRGLVGGLGLEPRHVSSPTFVLMQEYEPADPETDRPVLVHIDAYRIKGEEDLASIGWQGAGEELREQAVVAVEWASLIKPALGSDVLWIEITHEPVGRSVSLTAMGAWRRKLSQLQQALDEAGLVVVKGGKR